MINNILEIAKVLGDIIQESKKLSDEERALLQQFADAAPGNVDPETSEKYKKSLGRLNNFKQSAREATDETEKNILKGQIKREKNQNLYRFNNQASEKNPDLKNARKQLIMKFVRKKRANIGK